MVDTHTHILYNVDDGSRTLEESKLMIDEAYELGYKHIILTPHYIKDSIYTASEKEIRDKYNHLVKYTLETGKKIKLYLGNEIYIDNDIVTMLQNYEVFTLNNTRYLLIEFPRYAAVSNVREVVFEIRLKGYVPVIAHPERYEMFQENISLAEELFNQGVLYQGNLGSLVNRYGRTARKTLKEMLKKDLIFMVGSDVHHSKEIYEMIPKALKKLSAIVGKKKVEILTTINPMRIIEDKEIL